jgi:hypothetical protein
MSMAMNKSPAWTAALVACLVFFSGLVVRDLLERGDPMLAYSIGLIVPIGALWEWWRAQSLGTEAAEVGTRMLVMVMVTMEMISLLVRSEG